jgi:hypothetical protein
LAQSIFRILTSLKVGRCRRDFLRDCPLLSALTGELCAGVLVPANAEKMPDPKVRQSSTKSAVSTFSLHSRSG